MPIHTPTNATASAQRMRTGRGTSASPSPACPGPLDPVSASIGLGRYRVGALTCRIWVSSALPMAAEPQPVAPDETPIDEVNVTERKYWHDGPPLELFKRMRAQCPVHWTSKITEY